MSGWDFQSTDQKLGLLRFEYIWSSDSSFIQPNSDLDQFGYKPYDRPIFLFRQLTREFDLILLNPIQSNDTSDGSTNSSFGLPARSLVQNSIFLVSVIFKVYTFVVTLKLSTELIFILESLALNSNYRVHLDWWLNIYYRKRFSSMKLRISSILNFVWWTPLSTHMKALIYNLLS